MSLGTLLAGAQTRPGMKVLSARQGNVEMPLAGFADWITPVERFFVRSHAYIPKVEAGGWKLEIAGQVERPLALTMAELRQFPRAELIGVLECAGNGRAFQSPPVAGLQWGHGSVGNGRWTGVRLADVLRKAGLKPAARELLFDGADRPPGTMPKFQRTVPVAKALHPDTLLAFEMNGGPLPAEHGFPLRLVVPGWAGDNWAKWITRIEALDHEFEGFFMKTAYRRPVQPVAPGTAVDPARMEPVGALRVKSVIASPATGSRHPAAPLRLSGAAWTGESRITSVEVSTDSGRTWRAARLAADQAPYAWRLWEADWKPAREGYHVLMARARDASGDTQPLAQDWNPSGYLWNAVQQVGVEIGPGAPAVPAAKPPAAPPASVKRACLPCHDMDVTEQQRLNRAGWERELDKMIRWGAKVRPEEREEVLRFLMQFAP